MIDKIKKNNLEKYLDVIFSSFFSLMIFYFLSKFGISTLFILIPFIVLNVKYSIREMILSLIIFFIVSSTFTDIINLILQVGFIFISSLLISKLIIKKQNFENIMIYSSILVAVSFSLSIIVMFILDYNLIETIKLDFNNSIKNFENILSNDINMTSQELSEYILRIRDTFDYILSNIPAIIVCSSIVIAWTNAYLSIKLLNKTLNDFDYGLKMNELRIGEAAKPLINISAIVIIISYLIKYPYNTQIIDNLSNVLLFILFINGILVFDFRLQDRMMFLFRCLLILLMIFLFRLSLFFSILGFVDTIFDLRRKGKFNEI